MTAWLLTALGLLPPFGLVVLCACRGGAVSRLVAWQLASSLAALVLVAMTFAFDQPTFIDLPLAMALLALPGGLLIAMFLERWL